MKKTVLDIIKLAIPISNEKKKLLDLAAPHIEPEQLNNLKYFLKMDKLFGKVHDYGTTIHPLTQWVEFKSHIGDKEVHELIKTVNTQIKEETDNKTFEQFSEKAHEKISALIANNIIGLDEAKEAAALLLFAKEPIHILLLGDPGTGKTEILRSVAALSPKSSFGLGSGTTGAGLSAAAKGNELILGLLPQADQGNACIDELNLMKAKDRAALYSAMEKGFITYAKGTKHEQLDARVRVIATANPKGDTFVGQGASILKKQLPFEQALLSRFHLVFLIRKPNDHELQEITRKIVQQEKQKLHKGDVEFVKEYVQWSWKKEVKFPKKLEPMVVNFIEDLTHDKTKFLVEIGPRTVVGIMRLAEAHARIHNKETVEQKDLLAVMKILKKTLYVRENTHRNSQ